MDPDVLRLKSHLDQMRSELRAIVTATPVPRLVDLIKTCAEGALTELDEREQLLVGMLAIMAIFDMPEVSFDSD